jgi:hypothetical protein
MVELLGLENVLKLLLDSMSTTQAKLNLSWAAVRLWDEGVLNTLVDTKLVVEKRHAENIQCQGCEKLCNVDITKHIYPNSIRYYAACDDPVMHEQMGRMTIPAEQLKQWQTSIKRLANVIAGLLELSLDISYKADQTCIKLGSVKSKNGRRSVLLNVEPLTLVVNQTEMPVNEIIYFENNQLKLDIEKFDAILNFKQSNVVKTYTPNINKKEQRKANTQAMYQDWQDQANQLKTKQPTKSKKWISQQIAKMPIAQGKSSETVRKNIQI